MADEHNTHFVTWLKNAYALENQLIEVLQAHAAQAADFPTVQEKIEAHLEETKGHAEKVGKCLEELGEDPSAAKTAMGKVMGMMAGAGTAMAGDAIIKNAIAEAASEQMEIATYNAIITAADELGHPEIAKMCKEILAEEEAVAAWLADSLPTLVTEFLDKEAESDNA